MKIIISLLLIISLIILFTTINNRYIEKFDGIGKSFSQFYYPKKCCKYDNCYPGMYVRYNY